MLIALVLVVAFGIRLLEIQRTSYTPINDAKSYLILATEIAHIGDYSSHDPGAGGSPGPSAYFPPAYPYFLAAVHVISPSVEAARISQALLGTAAAGLVGLVALECFGEVIALIALIIAAVYPVMIELSATLVAENLLVALSLAAVWAILRARRAERPYAWAAAGGVLIGLAVLTHENALVLLIGALGLPRAPKAALLLLVVTALTIAPWTVRNAIVLHRFTPISDETGITLAGTYNPVSAHDAHLPYGWRLYLYGEPHHRLSEPALSGRLTSRALHYIGEHPAAPVQVAFHNTLRMFELEGSIAWETSAASIDLPRGTAEIGVISFWLLCLLALPGTFTLVARQAPRWLWLVPVLYALSIVFVNVETPRFRLPIDPFLILLAACAIGTAVARLTGAQLGRAPIRREHRAVNAA
jgi:4-amino-4-deoxy-L-arabinose transferase-like glycosyltransferase